VETIKLLIPYRRHLAGVKHAPHPGGGKIPPIRKFANNNIDVAFPIASSPGHSMSDNPFQEKPSNPYQSPASAPKPAPPGSTKDKSTIALVFGILNLIFGILGVCGILASTLMFFVPQNAQMQNPVLDVLHENGTFFGYMVASVGFGFVFTIVLIASGVGLLMMKMWGRWLAIGYGFYALFQVVMGTTMNFVFVWMPLMDKVDNLPPQQEAAVMGGMIGGVVGSCFGALYPVILLIFMFLPGFVARLRELDAKS